MIRKRKDRESWQVVIEIGRDPSTGRRRRKTVLVHDTKAEAKRVERRLQQEAEGGRNLALGGDKLTVRNFLAYWLEMVHDRIAPETWRSYESKLRIHVLPAIGNLRLTSLRPFHIEAMYGELTNKGLSQLTIHHVHAILREALGKSVKHELIHRNPCAFIDVGQGERKEMRTLSAQEAGRLLVSCEANDSPAAAAVAVMLLCALRLGETLGLRWSALDLEHGLITIKSARQRQVGRGLVERPPKTASSRRVIPCGPHAVQVLEGVRAQQKVLSLGDGLVFEGLTDTKLRREFKNLLEVATLPHLRLHDLRHSWATLFFQWGGADLKMASVHLGHSSIRVTADIYTHVPQALQFQAVQNFEGWLVGKNGAQMAHKG